MLKLSSISASKIKTYDTCLFKFWLTYHTEIELKSNWGAVIGTLMHDVLEQYSNDTDKDWVRRLYAGFGGILETKNRHGEAETMPSPLLLAKAKEYAQKKPYCDTCPHANKTDGICSISLKALDNLPGCPRDLFDNTVSSLQSVINRYTNIWPKLLKDNDGKIIGTEYPFRIMVPGTEVPMNGFMDLVIKENEDTIHVIDYKTGAWAQNYKECREDIQVKMYSLAARREFIDDIHKKGYKFKNVILTFDYFTKSPITLAFSKKEDDDTERFVQDKIREIESTEWIHRIVPNNVNFAERNANNGYRYFTCNAICDTGVCAKEWKGKFNTCEQK